MDVKYIIVWPVYEYTTSKIRWLGYLYLWIRDEHTKNTLQKYISHIIPTSLDNLAANISTRRVTEDKIITFHLAPPEYV